ncbi:hypothetical protein RRG08_050761 [Elysia crispata]|uniref:Uncharacterized protein n=1 Tax=Elysia crispata TaxID=231223 RepID=A0AAE1DKR5_9GAST|nr:hypothetical protein RRG08_050761 [Elysia crispata]
MCTRNSGYHLSFIRTGPGREENRDIGSAINNMEYARFVYCRAVKPIALLITFTAICVGSPILSPLPLTTVNVKIALLLKGSKLPPAQPAELYRRQPVRAIEKNGNDKLKSTWRHRVPPQSHQRLRQQSYFTALDRKH